MIRTNAECDIEIASGKCPHPGWSLQFADEEFDHFLFLRNRHHVADIHQRRSEIVAVMHFIVAPIRQTALPCALARNVKVEHAASKFRGLLPECSSLADVAFKLGEVRRKTKVVNVRRV